MLRTMYLILTASSVLTLIYKFVLEHAFEFPNLIVSLLPEFLILAFAVALTWPLFTERFRFRFSQALTFSLAAFAVSTLICSIVKKLGYQESSLYGSGLQVFLYTVVLAPLLEETFYRYMLWIPIENKWSPNSALVLTSLIFSLGHLRNYWSVSEGQHALVLVQGGITLTFGFVVGSINLRTRSLANMIFAHASANLAAHLVFHAI